MAKFNSSDGPSLHTDRLELRPLVTSDIALITSLRGWTWRSLTLEAIVAEGVSNPASWHVLEKLGFKATGDETDGLRN